MVLFEYQPTKSGQHAKRFLEGFKGILQSNGYSGYNAVPEVTHCGCFVHLQHKFEEALPKGSSLEDCKAAAGLKHYNDLFNLGKEWVDLQPEERYIKRLEHAKSVLYAFWSWISSLNVLQESNLGKAVTYAIN